MQILPSDESQMLASSDNSGIMGPSLSSTWRKRQPRGRRYTALTSLGGGTGTTLSAERPCQGPVTHTDSPRCVARKAMAQALQAEHDSQLIGKIIKGHTDETNRFRKWEHGTHDTLAGEMNEDFKKLDEEAERVGIQIDAQGRQLEVGDMTSDKRSTQLAQREANDMSQVSLRIHELNHQLTVISKMTGPPGEQGPPGSDPSLAQQALPSWVLGFFLLLFTSLYHFSTA